MYTNLILPRRWSRLTCYCRSVSSIEGQKLPQSTTSSDGISPPPRIQRGPTDILQALAATVGPDPTGAHYKFHDDPYLIPLSNYRKRAYALAAEAGRKAASWIRDEHAELFTTRVWDPPLKMKTPYFNADPKIEAFAPKPIYTDESKVTEEDLSYSIQNALLEDSMKIFQLLGGVENVNEKLKMDFLQLLCFCNEKEPESSKWVEERWFAASNKERQVTTWRLGGLADKIFQSMEPKLPEAYCAIIQGMAKYYQAERAHALAQEAIEKGIPLSTSVYNALLGCVGFLREGTSLRVEAMKALLTEMNQQGLTPNDETLTSCLRSISAWGAGRILQEFAVQILSEFKTLGIQPGLSAYYYLLCLYCKERGPRVDILTAMLDDLEKRDMLKAKEATDTNFFITAMGVCSDHLQNYNLAERLNALLMKDDNYKLVGDAYKESIYYRHYVTVHCRHAPFEKTTHILDTLIPNVYVPEPSVMEEIIKTLEVGGAGARLAQAWSQLVVFGMAKRVRLVERLLEAMCNCYPYQDVEIKAKMQEAAADIVKYGEADEEHEDRRNQRSPAQLQLSATALSDAAQLCGAVDAGAAQWEGAAAALARLRRGAAGVARPAALSALAATAAAHAQPALAAASVAYLAECGFDEAMPASVEVLAAMLNRGAEEVRSLLARPRAEVADNLDASALAVVEAYQIAKTGAPIQEAERSSSESDSDSTSDDE